MLYFSVTALRLSQSYSVVRPDSLIPIQGWALKKSEVGGQLPKEVTFISAITSLAECKVMCTMLCVKYNGCSAVWIM